MWKYRKERVYYALYAGVEEQTEKYPERQKYARNLRKICLIGDKDITSVVVRSVVASSSAMTVVLRVVLPISCIYL